MKAKLAIENPDEIQATMTLTMSVKHWKELASQLAHQWPSSDLSYSISDLVRQANKHFYPTPSED